MASSNHAALPKGLAFGVPDDDHFFERIHDSEGFQHLGGADLGDFIAVYESEAEFIAKLSVSHEESRRVLDSWKDDYLDWTENYNGEIGPFHFADPGVASTVTALSLIGALPIGHCVGTRGHEETHPLVSFWGEESIVIQVKAVAEETDIAFECTFEGSKKDDEKAVFLVSTTEAPSLMRSFALALATQFAHANEPGRLGELEALGTNFGNFVIPPWLLR